LVHSLPYSIWEQKRKLLEPQDSDEEGHQQDLLLLGTSSEDSNISLIKLDEHSEESYADNDDDDYEDDYADND
jgi:hypothetical protein